MDNKELPPLDVNGKPLKNSPPDAPKSRDKVAISSWNRIPRQRSSRRHGGSDKKDMALPSDGQTRPEEDASTAQTNQPDQAGQAGQEGPADHADRNKQ